MKTVKLTAMPLAESVTYKHSHGRMHMRWHCERILTEITYRTVEDKYESIYHEYTVVGNHNESPPQLPIREITITSSSAN